MSRQRKLWLALLVLVLLTPIGLFLPEALRSGPAWGEWSLDTVRTQLGYAPQGMQKTAGLWKAPLPEYGLPAEPTEEEPSNVSRGLIYLLTAALGGGCCAGAAWGLGRLVQRGKSKEPRS